MSERGNKIEQNKENKIGQSEENKIEQSEENKIERSEEGKIEQKKGDEGWEMVERVEESRCGRQMESD